jgi:hypothetical protein
MDRSLVPLPWQGTCAQIPDKEYHWLKEFGDSAYASLYQDWTSTRRDLPIGSDLYIVSFHLEAINVNWLKRQSEILKSPIIVLADGKWYDHKIENVSFYTYYYWHRQIEKLLDWYPSPSTSLKNITKKASGICYRMNLNKAIITVALLTELGLDDSVVSFGDWIGEDLVNYQKTGWPKIDAAVDYYRKNLIGKKLDLDLPQEKQLNSTDTYFQDIASDYRIPAYQECAINFTNESFIYSLMHTDGKKYIHPGPFLTEKTFKCLVSGTAFIPTGQFETYHTLRSLGLKFDYGFDTSWDLDSGNLSRMTSIVELIGIFKTMDAQDIYLSTLESTQHNQSMMFGEFQKNCQSSNDFTKQAVLSDFTG